MNKVILMGRLTRDPNVRYSPRNNSQEEMAIARYTLAVDRRGAKDGQQSADFISCVAFGRDGEFAEKYLKQGTKVVKGKYVVTCKGQEQETTVDAKVSAYKHPVYMGDLKEAITLFDRNVITIDMNDKAAGLWEKDMTGIKVRDRFDVQPVDDGAIIKGNITEVVQG